MKIFAIQNAQVNTGVSQFNQNSSKSSAVKTTSAGDKFVSKNVSFGMPSINELEAQLARLERQQNNATSKKVRERLIGEITKLRMKIESRMGKGGGYTSIAERAADHPYD